MENKGSGYSIVKGIADDAELNKYRLVFENNGSPRDITNLQWLHQQNLTGRHTIYYAMSGDDVAAIYTAMPSVFNFNGKKGEGLQSIDTMTDEAHRGKGLFPKLAVKLYEDAEKDNYELVYGFPNENSAPGFFKKLQWISFGEAPFLLKPLTISYFIKKLLKKGNDQVLPENHAYILPESRSYGNGVVKPLTVFGADYDVIWNKLAENIGVSVDRSAAYMNWRYVNKPGEIYSKCGYYIDGKLEGVIVFTIKNKHGGRIGYTMELIFDPKNEATGRHLLHFAKKVFKKEKTDTVLAWCFAHSFNYKSYRRAGYLNLPIKFRPQHLFLGVRALNGRHKAAIENIQNWYISYSDSDTV